MFYAHIGWIFQNPVYARWNLVDKRDLDRDSVAKFQHRWFSASYACRYSADRYADQHPDTYLAQGAVFFCFVLPALLGHLWGDSLGAFIWSGLVARVFSVSYLLLKNPPPSDSTLQSGIAFGSSTPWRTGMVISIILTR
jgi:stearoyl-CoA desaturase (delta-9 desaturase)